MDTKITEQELATIQQLAKQVAANFAKNIIGQGQLVESLLICLLAEGHLLVESVPGLAKTRAVRVLAESIGGEFKRLQFTPDLLPADIVGSQIYNQATGEFTTQLGPIFANIILADEINRAPAKVQSAMLECMQERQITIGGVTQKMRRPFMVMATQNPIEHEGTYVLPEAQLDRFMCKHLLTYPARGEEIKILDMVDQDVDIIDIQAKIPIEDVLQVQNLVKKVYVDPKIKEYVSSIIAATRTPGEAGLQDLQRSISYGSSPRGAIALMYAGRVIAAMSGRAYITPDDIKHVAHRCLRHRITLTYEAESEAVTPDFIIDKILQTVVAP